VTDSPLRAPDSESKDERASIHSICSSLAGCRLRVAYERNVQSARSSLYHLRVTPRRSSSLLLTLLQMGTPFSPGQTLQERDRHIRQRHAEWMVQSRNRSPSASVKSRSHVLSPMTV